MSSSAPKSSVQEPRTQSQPHTVPIVPDAPPRYPFAKLVALDRLESGTENPSGHKYERFRALVAPYRVDSGRFAYGGHVYAHAAYAASKTVEKGFVLHEGLLLRHHRPNITGSFTLPGVGGMPFTFTVRHVRNGATYCLRAVDVRQTEEVCFSALCSFKKGEKGHNFGHQPVADIHQKYKVALEGKAIVDHPLAPGVDSPEWVAGVENGTRQPVEFAGIEGRKVDMRKYNLAVDAKQHPERYRQLHFYRMMGLPGPVDETVESESGMLEQIRKADEDGEYDNLHVCAHLFASDRNSLYLIARALDRVNNITRIASLSHTVIIHTHESAMKTVDWDSGDDGSRSKWFTLEASTSRSGENRVLHQGQIWAPDGTLVATTMQDGLLRVTDHKL